MHPSQQYQPVIGKHRIKGQADPAAGRAGSGAASGSRSGTDQAADGREQLIKTAHHQLEEAYNALVAAGVGPEAVRISFLVAQLSLTQLEHAEANHLRLNPARHDDSADDHLTSGVPGLDLCPDPASAQTPAEFVQILQRYRTWAGNPSYRTMERLCGRRFAASTIHNALHAASLPSLDMVRAIIRGCKGSDAQMAAFTHSQRRLGLLEHAPPVAERPPALRAV